MQGVVVRKLKKVSEDDRRSIFEVMNGELAVKNMKVLIVKKGEMVLGNHWHVSNEIMAILKGGCKKYVMENLDTGEKEEFNLTEGDVVIRTGRIVHAGIFTEDSIVIDGCESVYINSDYNDNRKVILNNNGDIV